MEDASKYLQLISSFFISFWKWYSFEERINGVATYPNAAFLNPILAGLGAAVLIVAALMQALTARRRHEEQTEADRQRRISETFTKGIDQLGNTSMAIRLGGIYSLERVTRESEGIY